MTETKQKASGLLSNISFRVVVAVGLFLAALGVFSIIADEIVLEKEDWFDSRVFHSLAEHSSPFIVQTFHFFTFFGSPVFLFPAYVVLIGLLMYKHRKNDAIHVAVLCITGTLLKYGIKLAFARQ